VYSLNPALTEMLATERAAELSRQAAHPLRPGAASRRSASFRTATGWALVEIGLRLVVSRRCIGRGRVAPEGIGPEGIAMSGGAGIVAR
jgi:hypothetical protein